MKIESFRDLVVWQKSMQVTELVYEHTKVLPKVEQYGLMSQLQRAAVSIPSNIAEGCQRNNRAEFKQFCGIAYASSAELETQLILINRLYQVDIHETLEILGEVQRMLRQLVLKLTTKN